MTVTTKRSLIAFLLSLVLVVSIFTVSIFATDSATNSVTESATESTTEESSSVEETTAEKTEETTGKTESGSNSNSSSSDKVDTEAAQKEHTKRTLIINSVIIASIVVVAVVLIIRFRKKLFEFLRTVKSELKKIVWSSKTQTRKSFLVVVVVAIAVALLLFIVNTAFTNGISMLADLF